MTQALTFYIFSGISIVSALMVFSSSNPVKSVLWLVSVMVGVSGLFFNLSAPFVAMVQILVYAGAVVILFLFVVMIFDMKTEGKQVFSYGTFSSGLKVLFAGGFSGFIIFQIFFQIDRFGYLVPDRDAPQFEVRNLAKIIFTDYVFLFEVLGLLLLVIPIGTVALSRIRGGTHAE